MRNATGKPGIVVAGSSESVAVAAAASIVSGSSNSTATKATASM
jgi:hypothetical protein